MAKKLKSIILMGVVVVLGCTGCKNKKENEQGTQSDKQQKTVEVSTDEAVDDNQKNSSISKNNDVIENQVYETIVTDTATYDRSFLADLSFHILNYVDLKDSPANLYNEDYIKNYEAFRADNNNTYDLKSQAASFTDAFEKHFHEVNIVEFIPFYCKEFDEMKQGIKSYNSISLDGAKEFVAPYLECMDKERILYLTYWNVQKKEEQEKVQKFIEYADPKFQLFDSLFENVKKKPYVYMCTSLCGKGRGVTKDNELCAAVSIPSTQEEQEEVFFQVFYEMTHQLTDKEFIKGEIRMDDDTHKLSEQIVIKMDYVLFHMVDEQLCKDYIEWVGKDLTQEEFLKEYTLPDQDDHIQAMAESLME